MEKFFKYVESPSELVIDPNKLLFQEIINDFPFFQTAHLFLVIAQHQTDGIFFSDRDLRNAAIYSSDRALLYNYLTSKTKPASEQERIDKIESFVQEKGKSHFKVVEEIKEDIDKKVSTIKVTEKQNAAIIDKFIKEKPSIQKPTTEFYSPSKMAMRSITDDGEFVSETLAQIHVKTKNYEKAVKVYEKLSLIYPEKSNYFAEIIKSLKTKLNE